MVITDMINLKETAYSKFIKAEAMRLSFFLCYGISKAGFWKKKLRLSWLSKIRMVK
jgi:hypothetical protein